MYKINFILMLLVVGACFSSCTTYQYTARKVDIKTKNIKSEQQAVAVKTDFSKQVSATSDYHFFVTEAKKEAEFRCLQENDIDVIIDPVFKIEYNMFKFKNHCKATVIGFGGTYEEQSVGVEAVKNLTTEDIEKYKLLTDPEFMKHYYNQNNENNSGNIRMGDTYYINRGAGGFGQLPAVAPASQQSAQPLALAPDKNMSAPKPYFDYKKAKKLRNAGAGLTITGLVCALAIGMPLLVCCDENLLYNEGHDIYDAFVVSGITFTSVGAGLTSMGIPMWCVGSRRMKNGRNLELSVNTSQNGVGLGLTF